MLPVNFHPSNGRAADLSVPFAADASADRLADLPRLAWLAVGRSRIETARRGAFRATPRAILEATINDAGLAVAAWHVRDAIETSAYYAAPPLRRWTFVERRYFAAAHAAAKDAALAILVRRFLPAEDFDVLCKRRSRNCSPPSVRE